MQQKFDSVYTLSTKDSKEGSDSQHNNKTADETKNTPYIDFMSPMWNTVKENYGNIMT